MHLFIPQTLCTSLTETDFARLGAVTISGLQSTQLNPRGWPVVSSIRKDVGDGKSFAVTLSTDVRQIEKMLHALQDLRADASAVMVCGCEPIPGDLRAAIPVGLHGLLRRPQPADLIFLSERVLKESSSTESVLEAALRHRPLGLSVAGPVDSGRLPEPGPGRPTIELMALQTAIKHAMADVGGSEMQRKCMESGLLLLWDFLDESHAISQTMEGKGTPRTADYWHAIMHRREPDPDNAAYWFRRVGKHPAFQSLSVNLTRWLNESGLPAVEIAPILKRMMANGIFDPFATIELSRSTHQSVLLGAGKAYRIIQYFEILNLLGST